jgi:pyridoxamine 5'-phosphate oxidase
VDKKEILALINEISIGYLGTVDGNEARVRCMETFRADENGLIFFTSKLKNVFKQISKNPNVEVCYFTKGTQVRVRGKMEILEDAALREEIIEKRPYLKPIYKNRSEDLALMRLKGKATTWTMTNIADTVAPRTFIDLQTGNISVNKQ